MSSITRVDHQRSHSSDEEQPAKRVKREAEHKVDNTAHGVLQLLIEKGASEYPYLKAQLVTALDNLPDNERRSIALIAAPLLAASKSDRDYRDLLPTLRHIPYVERQQLVEQTERLLKPGSSIVFIILEALSKVPVAERDDMILHSQAFLSGHTIGDYEISDAIYAITKIPKEQRFGVIENGTVLAIHLKSGVYRCSALGEIQKIGLLDQYDVIQHVLQIVEGLGVSIHDSDYINLVRSVALIPAALRSDVIADAKPLLMALSNWGYCLDGLFTCLAALSSDERKLVIKQVAPLAQLTQLGGYRGKIVSAIVQLPVDQRQAVIDKAMPLLCEDYSWWCNSVDNFIQIVAITATEELEELLLQVKTFLNGQMGDTVQVLMACARVARNERQALLDDVRPLTETPCDLTELATILSLVQTMPRPERQDVIYNTCRVLCQTCPNNRLQVLQAVAAIPARSRGAFLDAHRTYSNDRNSRIAEHILNLIELYSGEAYELAETVEQALQFWLQLTNDFTRKLPEVVIDEQQNAVLTFLARLKTTAEYKNQTTRQFLATRVIEAFTVMQADDELKGLVISIMEIGLESCDDRIIAALDNIELQVRLYDIKKMNSDEQQEALKKLSEGILLLEMIQDKIQKLLVKFPNLDEIGLQLAIQIKLGKCCKLPVSTTNMLFDRCVHVPVDTIDAAVREIVQECTDERKTLFLESWDPWKEFQRNMEVVATYDSLPPISREVQNDDICALTQEKPKQPVYYNHTLYDYDSFITLYRKTGKDPMNQDSATNTIQLSGLKRVETHKSLQ